MYLLQLKEGHREQYLHERLGRVITDLKAIKPKEEIIKPVATLEFIRKENLRQSRRSPFY